MPALRNCVFLGRLRAFCRLAISQILIAALVSATFLTLSAAANPTSSTPATQYWDGKHLANIKRSPANQSTEIKTALKQLRWHADAALERGLYSVVDKEIVPPSGDKHDYLSFSRYWWPNPDTKDGLPYIRRDGEVNRKLLANGDRNRLGDFCDDVEALALAGYLLADEKYARHAAKLIRTWYLDPETRMNPNVNFGQGVPGRAHGRGPGIIDTRHFLRVIDSIALLKNLGTLQQQEIAALKMWFNEYLDWLLTSDLGHHELKAKNNHGSWYAAQVVGVCLFVDRLDEAKQAIRRVRDERIPNSIMADGSQPEELARTKTLHYSLFNLSALATLSRFGEHLDSDIWHHQTERGAGLKTALEFITPYLANPEDWQYPEMGEFALSDRQSQTLLLVSNIYESDKLAEALKNAKKRYQGRYFGPLMFPGWTSSHPQSNSSAEKYRVHVTEEFQANPLAYEPADLSAYNANKVRESTPPQQAGIVRVAPAREYPLLGEATHKLRGEDLKSRQGADELQVIAIDSGVLTLEQVAHQVASDAIVSNDEGIVTLKLPLLVGPGSTLIVDGATTKELRLSTDRGAFLANAGSLYVLDTQVTSWSQQGKSPTLFTKKERYRPFLASYIRSKTYVAGSTIQHLGFAAPTAYGFSLSSHPERERGEATDDWPTGILVGNKFIGMYYGFYSFEARDVAIVNNDYVNCIVYGIDPHDRSTRLLIAENRASGTVEKHGIIGSRGISHSQILNNVSFENHGSGIMLDRQCTDNEIVGNKVYSNGQGIAIYESPANVIAENLVAFNADSGVRVRNSTDIQVRNNTIVGQGDYALEVYSKKLSDHKKRIDRGDRYKEDVSVEFFGNRVSGNRGFAKATNLNRLSMTNVIQDASMAKFAESLALQAPPIIDGSDRWLGQELKPLKRQLRPLFRQHESLIEISRSE